MHNAVMWERERERERRWLSLCESPKSVLLSTVLMLNLLVSLICLCFIFKLFIQNSIKFSFGHLLVIDFVALSLCTWNTQLVSHYNTSSLCFTEGHTCYRESDLLFFYSVDQTFPLLEFVCVCVREYGKTKGILSPSTSLFLSQALWHVARSQCEPSNAHTHTHYSLLSFVGMGFLLDRILH